MEILFENNYVRNKELAKEIYRYYFFRRKLMVLCYVLLSLSLLINILTAIFDNTYHLFIFVFVPLFFLLQAANYHRYVNTMVERDIEIHGKEISVETIVTDEYIQNTASTGMVNKLEYSKIKNAVQTKNLILLCSKANLVYIFRKDTFTKGSKEEFIIFLRGKGINI